MMNAQICHSQTGAERKMPIAKAIRIRMSNAAVTVPKFSAANRLLALSPLRRIGWVTNVMIGSVTKNASDHAEQERTPRR